MRDRRELLRMMATSGVAIVAGGPRLLADSLRETPDVTRGPFYPNEKPLDRDADLTRVEGRKGVAAGTIVDISGRILDRNGAPIRNARIEIWQANTYGRYAHPWDRNTRAALDPNFQGYAIQTTGADGRYRFKTIKPGAYSSGNDFRAPHIHFDVQGRDERKVTQMFFPGEPLNEDDSLLRAMGRRREALIANAAKDIAILHWDIVLAEG